MKSLKHPASIRLWLYTTIFSLIAYVLALLLGYLIYPPFVDTMSSPLLYVVEAVVTILLLRCYFRNSHLSAEALLKPSQIKFSWPKLIGLFLCTFCLSNAATLLFRIGVSLQFPDVITNLARNLPVEETMSSGIYFISTLIYLIVIAFLVPFWEEIIFRGLLLNQWMARYGSWKGIVFSALFFGVLHLDHFFGATLIGLMFACIAVETKTLKYTVLLHMIFNNIASIDSYRVLFTLKHVTPITTNPYLEYANLSALSLTLVLVIISAIPYTLYLIHFKRNLTEDSGFLTYEEDVLEDNLSETPDTNIL